MTNIDMKAAALELALKGFPVFPCNPITKGPLSGHGFKDATKDPVTIAKWWEKTPTAMIGVPTGKASGFWVLDIDDPELFWANCAIDLPDTQQVKTGRGVHLYWRLGDVEVRNNQKSQKHGQSVWAFPNLPGADVRGEGGYVIVPPSLHPNGVRYEILNDTAIAEAPAELLRIVTKQRRGKEQDAPPLPVEMKSSLWEARDTNYGLSALAGETASIRSAPDGAQEFTLNVAALKMGSLVAGGELSIETARNQLIAAGTSMVSYNQRDPWTINNVEKKVEHGLTDGAKQPRSAADFVQFNRSLFGEYNLAPARHSFPNRPTVKIIGGNLPEMVDEAEQALIKADQGYYQSGGRIVRAGSIPTGQGSQCVYGRFRIIEVGEAELVEAMTIAANWTNPFKKPAVRFNCPTVVAKTYLARQGKWQLRSLAGVIDIPTLRPDGSLLWKPGYDAVTGLLLVPSGIIVPEIPEAPTRDDALMAMQQIKELIAGFPFVTDADLSVALSALLTSVCRPALASAPLHGFTAPTAGSGKSTLVDLASVLRTGRPAAPIAQGNTVEELEKRLGALLLEGEGIVAIDNCEAPLGGEFLCQLMTQPSLKVRPLGRTVMIEVPTSAMVTATGNNLTFIGDMGRRALLCQLDPGVERPELREFSFNPAQVMTARRGEYVAAALTILIAYHVDGRPSQVPPLGSFGDWSDLVRSALIWLGCADPCETMNKVRTADPQLALIKQVMEPWSVHLGNRGVTTTDLSNIANETVEVSPIVPQEKSLHQELREALIAVAGSGGHISGRKLGHWLAKQRDRVVGGRRFISPETRGGQLVWVLEHVDA